MMFNGIYHLSMSINIYVVSVHLAMSVCKPVYITNSIAWRSGVQLSYMYYSVVVYGQPISYFLICDIIVYDLVEPAIPANYCSTHA